MWCSQRPPPNTGVSLNCNPWHLMAILRLKRFRKMTHVTLGIHAPNVQSPRPSKAWRGKKNATTTFWSLTSTAYYNILKLLKRKRFWGFCPPQCPQRSVTRATAFRADDAALGLPSCCQLFSRHLGASTHPSMPGSPRLQTHCDFLLHWWTIKNSRTKVLSISEFHGGSWWILFLVSWARLECLGQGTVMLFHLAEVKVIEVAGIWCWCILSGQKLSPSHRGHPKPPAFMVTNPWLVVMAKCTSGMVIPDVTVRFMQLCTV